MRLFTQNIIATIVNVIVMLKRNKETKRECMPGNK